MANAHLMISIALLTAIVALPSRAAGLMSVQPNAEGVQFNSKMMNSGTSNTITFTKPQKKGSVNLVWVGWDTAVSVVSVTDSSGNNYSAVGSQGSYNGYYQTLYAAKNIAPAAASANTVTVTFSSSTWSDVRVAEYTGVDPLDPIDSSNMAYGAGQTMATFPTATSPRSLIVSGIIGDGYYNECMTGERIQHTSEWFGVILDRTLLGTGGVGVSCTQEDPEVWIMHSVVLRAIQPVPEIPITFVQGRTLSGSSPGTFNAGFTNPQTAGNFNVVAIFLTSGGSKTVTSVMDTYGRTYQQVGSGPVNLSSSIKLYLYFLRGVTGGSTTVQVNFSSSGNHTVHLAEYSGMNSTGGLDAYYEGTGANDFLMAPPPLTTSSHQQLIIPAAFNNSGSMIFNPSAGFTRRTFSTSGSYGYAIMDKVVYKKGSYPFEAAMDPEGAWMVKLAAFPK